MKSLKCYLIEDLNEFKNTDAAQLAAKEYINANYEIEGRLTFKDANGVCVVNCDGNVTVKNKEIEKLTDGFKWDFKRTGRGWGDGTLGNQEIGRAHV